MIKPSNRMLIRLALQDARRTWTDARHPQPTTVAMFAFAAASKTGGEHVAR